MLATIYRAPSCWAPFSAFTTLAWEAPSGSPEEPTPSKLHIFFSNTQMPLCCAYTWHLCLYAEPAARRGQDTMSRALCLTVTVNIQQALVKNSFSVRPLRALLPERWEELTPVQYWHCLEFRQQKPAQPTRCSAAWLLCQTCLQLYFSFFCNLFHYTCFQSFYNHFLASGH